MCDVEARNLIKLVMTIKIGAGHGSQEKRRRRVVSRQNVCFSRWEKKKENERFENMNETELETECNKRKEKREKYCDFYMSRIFIYLLFSNPVLLKRRLENLQVFRDFNLYHLISEKFTILDVDRFLISFDRIKIVF